MSFHIVRRMVAGAIALILASSSFSVLATVEQGTASENIVTSEDNQGEVSQPLSVTIGDLKNTVSGVEISWVNTDGLYSYAVYRKTVDSDFTQITVTEQNSYVDTDVKSGEEYTYIIKTLDADGVETGFSSEEKSTFFVGVPTITKLKNTANGTKVYWSGCEGADKYEVSFLNDENVWEVIEVTEELNCLHDGLESQRTYTYTVRCVDNDGNYLNDASEEKSGLFIAPIKVSKLSNTGDGVSVKWKAVNGAAKYKVYRKTTGSSWVEIATTKKASYTDKKVTSNVKYSYGIACLDADGDAVSVRGSQSSIKYIKAPTITKFQNTATGTTITWSESKGAAKYRIYYIEGNGSWNYLATVKATTYTHKNLKNGKKYTYKVKCLDNNNNAVSGTKEGKTNLFVKPVQVSGVSKTKKGTLVKWNSVKGVAGYRVYRRAFGGEWKKLGDVYDASTYTDTTAKKDKVYNYSVRCLDKNGKLISAYKFNGVYYKNSKLAKGIIGSKSTGWYYVYKNGKINYNYVNGVKQDGVKWIVTNGKAKKVSTRADGVLYRAAKEVTKATDITMTKEQKLKACFDYVKVAYIEKNPRIPHYKGMDWPLVYADDMLIRGVGNCCSYAATFAFMAKAIGYTEVYCCNSGGHGWAEIDGLVYDPEWSRHRFKYSYYALSYDTVTDQNYKGAIAAGYSWMRIKI